MYGRWRFICIKKTWNFITEKVQKLRKWFSHVVKGEKWACGALEAGKNKPILYIAETLDFKRFSEINKEKSKTDF